MKKENKGLYSKPTEEVIDREKPSMFLIKTPKGGLYFFSPKKTAIFFMNTKHVRELLEDKREFACIYKDKVKYNVDK